MSNLGRTPAIAQRLVSAYITALRQHLPTSSVRQLDQLPGASEAQLTRLLRSYPGAPPELLSVLSRANGTCWESLRAPPGTEPSRPTGQPLTEGDKPPTSTSTSPAGKPPTLSATAASYLRATFAGPGGAQTDKKRVKIAVPILGSALGACPYYLMSVEQMLSARPFLPPPWKNGARQPAYSDALSEGEPHDTHSAALAAASADSATPPPSTAGTSSHRSTNGGEPNAPYTIASLYEGYRIIHDAAEANAAAGQQHDATPTPLTGTPTRGPTPTPPTPSPTTTATQKLQKIMSGEVGVNQAAGTTGGSIVPPVPPPASGTSVGVPSTSPALDMSATTQSPAVPSSTATVPAEGGHWVYVDPRVDTHADLNRWIGFADSIYPHHQRKIEVKQQLKQSNTGGDAQKAAPNTPAPLPLYKTCESRLFVDFAPSELGTPGQIVQFVRGGQRTTKKRVTLYTRDGEEDECTPTSAVTVGECDSFTVIASDFGDYLKMLIREEFEFTEDLEDEEDEEDDGDAEPSRNPERK